MTKSTNIKYKLIKDINKDINKDIDFSLYEKNVTILKSEKVFEKCEYERIIQEEKILKGY